MYYSAATSLPPLAYFTYFSSGQAYIPGGYDWQNAPD
jgi:hypothetical protein